MMRQTFDYKNNAGAIVLGINGLVVKTHGSAGQQEYFSALQLLYHMAQVKKKINKNDLENKKI